MLALWEVGEVMVEGFQAEKSAKLRRAGAMLRWKSVVQFCTCLGEGGAPVCETNATEGRAAADKELQRGWITQVKIEWTS